MTYLVVYDIEIDKIRNRMAKMLEGEGQRVQESVFECELTPSKLPTLLQELKQALGDPGNGNLRVYRICEDCRRASYGVGQIVHTISNSVCIIV